MIRSAAMLLAVLATAPVSAQEAPPSDAPVAEAVPDQTSSPPSTPAAAMPSAPMATPAEPVLAESTATSPAQGLPAAADPAVVRARELFAKMASGEAAFDPAVADLYCDDALIRNTRTLADGSQQVVEIPAPQYKQLIRTTIPLAAARADRIEYSDVVAVPTAGGVRVTASRHSLRKEAAEPVSLLVGDCAGGGYGIREDISQTSE